MTDFVYCYLSPFAVGLLAFAVVILAAVAICFIISKIYNWVIYGINPTSPIRRKIDRTVAWFDKWVGPAAVGVVLIGIVVLLAFGAWDIGIQILKRAACK